MIRRLCLLSLAYVWLLCLLPLPRPSVLGSVDLSATILTNTPPTIIFVTPTDGQTGVPADANIVVEVRDSAYAVNLSSVQIIINGVTYTPGSPRVITTGTVNDYTFTVTPYDPLFTNQVDTVLIYASNSNGNAAHGSITFNVPISPTSTPNPTSTPQPTPTPGGPTSTPGPNPTSTPRPTATITPGGPTLTPRPTLTPGGPTPTSPLTATVTPGGPTPTPNPLWPTITPGGPTTIPGCPPPIPLITPGPNGFCPAPPACSAYPIIPGSSIGNTLPNNTLDSNLAQLPNAKLDKASPVVVFIQPPAKGTIRPNDTITFSVSDPDSGVNISTVKLIIDQQIFTTANLELAASGKSTSLNFTFTPKKPLTPNAQHQLTVEAFDYNHNGISKSIFFQTTKPFPYWLLLLVFPVGLLLFFLIRFIHRLSTLKPGQTIGIVYNSQTHEPLTDLAVAILTDKDKVITTVKTNVFGIFAADLAAGSYRFLPHHPSFKFPSVIEFNKLNFPHPYHGQAVKFTPNSNSYFYLPVDPTAPIPLSRTLPAYGQITDYQGVPMAALTLNLVETKFNTIVTKRITDKSGNYRFLVPRGRYQLFVPGNLKPLLTIDTRHQVGGYTTINQKIMMAK